MGFLQNRPIQLNSGGFRQKMMDFRIFLGFSERDFGSCGRQRNVCFQEFACCRAEFVLFSSDPGYLNSEEFDCRGGTGLRDCSLRSKLCCCDRWLILLECKYRTAGSYCLGRQAVTCQLSRCSGLVMFDSRLWF